MVLFVGSADWSEDRILSADNSTPLRVSFTRSAAAVVPLNLALNRGKYRMRGLFVPAKVKSGLTGSRDKARSNFGFVASVVTAMLLGTSAVSAQQSAELTERMEKEKAARKSCKIEICKAFAAPTQGAPITCEVTKTWTKAEILARVVGGSYVWGYGHMQCNLALNLDRNELAKALKDPTAKSSFAEHKLVCNVDDADAAKGKAFSVNVALTPVATFEKGEAKSVELQPVKIDGSAVASAAVTSLMAIDKASGLVSRGAAADINSFFYTNCAADGVPIELKK
jgi:hypothetical protein